MAADSGYKEDSNIIIWQHALELAKAQVPASEFLMWFRLEYLDFEDGTLRLRANNIFLRDQFLRKYGEFMRGILSDLLGMDVALEVEAQPSRLDAHLMQTTALKTDSEQAVAPRSMNSETPASSASSSSTQSQNKAEVRPAAPAHHRFGDEVPDRDDRPSRLVFGTLQERYTFENFVEGENNNFAYRAALSIAEQPGRKYNPLLIHGGVGMGKTHLMHAIGNRVLQTHRGLKIICITAEDFTNEFIKTIHDRSTGEFKNKYRNIDVLLIDDIHFFQSKLGVQEELFHTFNALYDANKQIVFTCDRPASELKDFSERLRSRFMMGMMADLTAPNYETRVAIVHKKLEEYHRTFPEDAVEVLAKTVETNVRELDAAVKQVIAYADLIDKEPNAEIVSSVLKNMYNRMRPQSINVGSIIRTVADYYMLSVSDIKGKKRSKNIALARQVAMYIIREITDYSTTEIGTEFNGRDHTTVMHSCQKIEDMIKFDATFSAVVQRLIRECKEASQ